MTEFQSSLDIANTALQLLGVPRITSFTQDSKGASAVAFVYDKVRKAELQRNVWRFSTRVVALRAIDTTVMQLVPAAWSATVTYPVGSIVSFGGEVYQALQYVPLNQEPDTTAYWDIYFGSMNAVPWTYLATQQGPAAWNAGTTYDDGNVVTGADGNTYFSLVNGNIGINPVGDGGVHWQEQSVPSGMQTTQGYYAGELVYVLEGNVPLVYMSLENGNTDNPSEVAAWNATTTYNLGDTVVLNGFAVTYNGLPVFFNGIPVTYEAGIFQSTQDLNLNNIPGDSPAWEPIPSTQANVMQGQNWLLLNAGLQSIRFVYPIGCGPAAQQTTRNVFQLPNGYLKEAPQDPSAGQFSFLGAPSQVSINDWEFQGNYITSSDTSLILLRAAMDVTSVPNMTSMFCNGLACRIATAVCEELTQSTAKLSLVANEYKTFMGDARLSNAIENGPTEIPLEDFIACRIQPMPSASYLQTSFLGGEWSPYAQGRADQETYRTAMNLSYNGLPLEVGAWTRRPGTAYCGTTLNNQPAVLRAFHFAQNAPYNIEFTNLAMRFWAGQTLVPGTTTTPYLTAELPALRVVQEEQLALVLHSSHPPQTLLETAAPPSATFSFGPSVFNDGPYLDPPTDGTTLTPNQVGTGLTLTASSTASINNGQGFLATDVGRAIRLYSQPVTWDATTNWLTGQNVFWKGVPYVATQNAGHSAPDADVSTTWAIAPSAAQWTWGTIATVVDTTHVTVTLAPADPLTILAGGPLLYIQAIVTWQLGLYSTTTGWPAGGCFHEGRFWLFGQNVNRIDSTMSGITANGQGVSAGNAIQFSPTLIDGTPADNCGISAILMGEDRNILFWAAPDHNGIILGTQAGEWLIQASNVNEVLTPTSIQAHRVTKFGCANVEPRMANFSHLFVQRYTQQLYEYVADVYSGKFAGTNLARKAKHLTAPGIAEIAYQAELVPCLWARTIDGRLIGMTYKRESPFTTQPATFVGWHQHFLGSGRTITSIQAGPSPDGTTDSLMLITTDGSTYWVEQMTSIFDETQVITNAAFLDAAVVPTVAVSGLNLTLSGLPYANGTTVSAWVGGYDLGDAVVESGAITVPAVAGAPTTPALVGFNYVSKGQILRPVLPAEGGWQTGPGQGKLRRSHYAAPLLANSQGVSMGVDFNTMRAMKFMSAGGTVPLAPNVLFSGVYWDLVDDDYTFNSMWCWQTTRPYPTTIVSVEVMVAGSDNA